MVHKGITHYSGEFAANINLGQPGFLVINATSNIHFPGTGTDGTPLSSKYYPKVNQWAALKNCTDPGAGVATNGAIEVTVGCFTGESGVTSTVDLFMGVGDIIFGPFSSVQLKAGATTPILLAYIG